MSFNLPLAALLVLTRPLACEGASLHRALSRGLDAWEKIAEKGHDGGASSKAVSELVREVSRRQQQRPGTSNAEFQLSTCVEDGRSDIIHLLPSGRSENDCSLSYDNAVTSPAGAWWSMAPTQVEFGLPGESNVGGFHLYIGENQNDDDLIVDFTVEVQIATIWVSPAHLTLDDMTNAQIANGRIFVGGGQNILRVSWTYAYPVTAFRLKFHAADDGQPRLVVVREIQVFGIERSTSPDLETAFQTVSSVLTNVTVAHVERRDTHQTRTTAREDKIEKNNAVIKELRRSILRGPQDLKKEFVRGQSAVRGQYTQNVWEELDNQRRSQSVLNDAAWAQTSIAKGKERLRGWMTDHEIPTEVVAEPEPEAPVVPVTTTLPPIVVSYYMADGAQNCPDGDTITTEAECQEAASIYGPYEKQVYATTGRPAGCFWDTVGSVYFNSYLDGHATWGGVGAICRATTYGPSFVLLTEGTCPQERQVSQDDCLAAAISVGADASKTQIDGLYEYGRKNRPAGCTLRSNNGRVDWWGPSSEADCGNLFYGCVCMAAAPSRVRRLARTARAAVNHWHMSLRNETEDLLNLTEILEADVEACMGNWSYDEQLASEVNISASYHAWCRDEEADLYDDSKTKCDELYAFLNAMTDPDCTLKDATRDSDWTVEWTTFFTDGYHFFEGNKPWYEHKRDDCVTATDLLASKITECDGLQADYETKFCAWREHRILMCDEQDVCVQTLIDEYYAAVARFIAEAEQRMAEARIVAYVQCLMDEVQSGGTQEGPCDYVLEDDYSHYNITVGDLPTLESCDTSAVTNYPRSGDSWSNYAYANFSVKSPPRLPSLVNCSA